MSVLALLEQRAIVREADRDPLAAVLALGSRTARLGAAIALVIALSGHLVISWKAVASLLPMKHAVEKIRAGQHEFLWTTYDIELPAAPKKAEEPPPPPPPPAVAEPPPPVANLAPKAPTKEDPYDPPPTPAQATKVLTAPAKEDEPLDLTGKGFVTGDGSGPGYGMVSAAGTGSAPTFNPRASNTGTPGGTGAGGPPPPPPPPPGPDLSRPPTPAGGSSWNCPFPPEADTDQVDQAIAVIVVTVKPDGTPLTVKVVTDPGHGFGRAARMCALGRSYHPGLDRAGQPTTLTSPPITVRFTR